MTVPFLSLSRETQLMVYTKMENMDLHRVASSCRDVYRFTEKHRKKISSRPHYGDSFYLRTGEDGAIVLSNNFGEYVEEKKFDLTVDKEFYDKTALVSTSGLEIGIYDQLKASEMLDILRKWNPLCHYINYNQNMPLMTALQLAETVRTLINTDIYCTKNLFKETKDVIKKSPKCGRLSIFVRGSDWEDEDTLEEMRPFGGFCTNTVPKCATAFLLDLVNSRDPGNLVDCYLYFNDTVTSRRPLSNERPQFESHVMRSTDSKFLFVQFRKNGSKKSKYWTIQKLPLKNNMCALIEEKDSERFEKTIKVCISKDDDEEILKHLLRSLGICKTIFTNKRKQFYLTLDDSERMKELGMLYCYHEQILYTEMHENCYV